MRNSNKSAAFNAAKMMKPRALPLLISAALCAPIVQAQTSGKATLEEIIVTAQKQEENIQNVPITIAVLGGEDLKSSGIDTQRALAMATPNVTVNTNANYVAPYIRGIGTQYANPGLEPSVAAYFNDVYLSRPSAGLMSFHDIERVEVLKGPQGTLYGRNTTGGAIRVITKDPTENFEAGIGGTIGNYGTKKVDFYVSGPLTDTLQGRISGMTDKNDGWIKNINDGPDMQNRDLQFIHGKLHWEPSDQFTVAFMVDYTRKRDYEGSAFAPLFTSGPENLPASVPFLGAIGNVGHDEYSGNFVHENSYDAGGAELRADYAVNDALSLISITGFRYVKFQGFADLDTSNVPLFNADTQLERTEDYSQEFQFLFNDGGKFSLNAGLYFMYESATDNFGLGGLAIDGFTGNGAFIGGDGGVEVKSGAAYGEANYAFTDEWEAVLGLRYTKETKRAQNDFYTSVQQADGTPATPYSSVLSNPEQKVSFNELSPKFQINWRPAYGVMIFANYQEGFKSGGFNMPTPAPGDVPEVSQETIKAAEIGWKTQFDRIRFNGSIFHYKLEDLQIQVTDINAGITSVKNAGSAKIDGIEADLTFAATESLQLGGGFGYQKAEFGSVPGGQYTVSCADIPAYEARGFARANTNFCFAPGPFFGLGLAEMSGNLKGNDLPQSPELSGYLRATYTQDLSGSGKIEYSTIASYTDEFSWTADNIYKEPSKTLVNANVTWHSADEKYSMGVYCTNLTDEEYATHNAPFSTGGWRVAGAPRMFGVRVGAEF
jgi:iron complex outermembrane receptor protein